MTNDARRGPVVAIGNFDGLHRGHRAVLAAARVMADARGVPAALLTFEPHPRAVFQPDRPMFRLTPPDLKADIARRLGMDTTIFVPFDRALAALTAAAFADGILARDLDVSGVVIGYDFHFGHNRAGTPEWLSAWARGEGRAARIVAPVSRGETPVSSSAIRAALADGAVETAAAMIGDDWIVRGIVGPGDQRGRDLGYPTANLTPPPGFALRHGIYAVQVAVHGTDTVHDGVASFGRRPTFDNGPPLLEVHLFGFAGDLYGRALDVAFVAWLRPEQRFDGVDALVAQMDADSARAASLLAGHTPRLLPLASVPANESRAVTEP